MRTTTARCLVITGADPAFCSGDDVREVMGGGDGPKPVAVAPRLTPAADALLHTNVPVIAAVNGAAVGWGMELALMADIRVASERAKFGELFVLRGLCSDVAGIGRLAQLVGRERAAEMLFTGDVIDAATARAVGPRRPASSRTRTCCPTAMELAAKIASRPPLAVQQLKAGLRRVLDPDWTDFGVWVSTTLGAPVPHRGPPRGREVVPRTTRAALHRPLSRPLNRVPQPGSSSRSNGPSKISTNVQPSPSAGACSMVVPPGRMTGPVTSPSCRGGRWCPDAARVRESVACRDVHRLGLPGPHRGPAR